MIRINLLKQLQSEAIPFQLIEPGNKRNKTVLIGGGLLVLTLLVVALLQYPSLLGGMFSKPAAIRVEPVSELPEVKTLDTLTPKRITANAVEETVRDLGASGDKQIEPLTYANLVPSEKIEFQYFVSNRILRDIKAATPPDVGFADFIFTPPGDFYVHGLARTEESYQRFKRDLGATQNCQLRPGKDAPAGRQGSSKEFSFYGSMEYPLTGMPVPPDHIIPKAKLPDELFKVKSVAGKLGIKIKEPKLLSKSALRGSTRMVYQVVADCNFQQMQDFLNDLRDAKCNLGIIKFSLQARANERIVAEVDLLAYIN